MKLLFIQTRRSIIGLLGLFVVASGPAYADYNHGLEAYQDGQFEIAIKEFRALAERGHSGAQFMLGVMYFNGSGVSQNNRIAAIFFHQSAQQGEAGAQLALGSILIRGIGVFQDLVLAQTWLSLAAINGTGDLKTQAIAVRDATQRLMTDDQLLEAERHTLAWRPTLAGLVRFEP